MMHIYLPRTTLGLGACNDWSTKIFGIGNGTRQCWGAFLASLASVLHALLRVSKESRECLCAVASAQPGYLPTRLLLWLRVASFPPPNSPPLFSDCTLYFSFPASFFAFSPPPLSTSLLSFFPLLFFFCFFPYPSLLFLACPFPAPRLSFQHAYPPQLSHI